jgi:hypothetical protein
MKAFLKELGGSASVWTIEDADGIPAPKTSEGARSMPFWSKRSRAERIIKTIPAYSDFTPREVPLEEWTGRWLPGLRADGFSVGLNWSGATATGYDVKPEEVQEWLGRM